MKIIRTAEHKKAQNVTEGNINMNLTENITDRDLSLTHIHDTEIARALEMERTGVEWDVLWTVARNRDDDDTLADLVDLIDEATSDATAAKQE